MIRLGMFMVIAFLAACSDSDSSSGSGVDQNKKLIELTSSERQQLCEYMVEAQGGVHSKMCGDGLTITVMSASECDEGFAGFAPSCAATVDHAEACGEAAGDDLCNLLSSPSCGFLFECL
jgi:hypothetical protein